MNPNSPQSGAKSALQAMPSVDHALHFEAMQNLCNDYLRGEVVTAIRDALTGWRTRLLDSTNGENGGDIGHFLLSSPPETILERLAVEVRDHLAGAHGTSLQTAINATGVVLHTNLGRAVMPEEATEAVVDVSRSYSLLEMDRDSGLRSKRDVHVLPLFLELTGAEAVTFVNNNAGATLIILDTLAQGKEVLLSRGEMVEIGGSFRIPDVMEKSGAKLVGVGTTNRTHLKDYRNAITENTGAILRVHPSNYQVVGFTKAVPLEELVALGQEHGIPVVDDLGSGCLADLSEAGLDEPLLSSSLSIGADLVCFSTDKLLGGPQGGGIAGKKEWVDAVRKNPLARALRMDKLRLAALEATLRLYRNPDVAREKIPTVRMILTPPHEVKARAQKLAEALGTENLPLSIEVSAATSNIGGGSLPNRDLETYVVRLRPSEGSRATSQHFAYALRMAEPPVIARIHKEEVFLDLRTILPGQEALVAQAVRQAVDQLRASGPDAT